MEDSENGNIWGGWHTAAVCQGWGLESQLEEGNGESWCVCVCEQEQEGHRQPYG